LFRSGVLLVSIIGQVNENISGSVSTQAADWFLWVTAMQPI
jgi:hypothetical protein